MKRWLLAIFCFMLSAYAQTNQNGGNNVSGTVWFATNANPSAIQTGATYGKV
jgi:hypothetical protein